MANKKKQVIGFSVVSVLLVVALVLSLTAIMSVDNGYKHFLDNGIRNNTAAVSDTAPLADGEVANGYQTGANTQASSIDEVRANGGGNFYLAGPITVGSLDTNTTFRGTLDGCGNTVTINASITDSRELVGGLFAELEGTVKNLKIVVEKFSVSTGKGDVERDVGIIAGQLNGGTVENVSVEFRYSPSNVESNSGDAYFMDNGVHKSNGGLFPSAKNNWLCFGGVAGVVNDSNSTIKNVTTINNTTGEYGISTYCSVNKSGSGSISTNVAAGMVLGHIKSGATCNIENVTLKRGVGGNYTGKISIIQSAINGATSSCESGLLFGKNAGTLNINGVIIDDSYFQVSDFFSQLTQKGTNSKQCFGSLVGTGMDTSRVKNIIAPKDPGWLDGDGNNLKGVIVSSGLDFIAFDKGENSGNVIIGTKYNSVADEKITAYIDFAGVRTNVLSYILNTSKAGQTVYVSVAKSDTNAGTVSFVDVARNSATIEYSLNERGQYELGTKEFDGQAYAPVVKVGSKSYTEMWHCNNNSGNVGTYIFDLDLRNKTLESHDFIIDGGKYAFVDYVNCEIYFLEYESVEAVGQIVPKNLVLTWNNSHLTYAGQDQVPTASVNDIYGQPLNLSIEGKAKDVGNYTATASLFIPSSNYNVTNPTCEFDIAPMVLGGEFAFKDNNVYSGSDKKVIFNVTSGQLFNGDALALTYAEGADRKNAGTFGVTVTVPSQNYTFADGKTALTSDMQIAAKDVNLVLTGATRQYNGQAEDFSSYAVDGKEGFVAEDNVSVTVSTVEENSANAGRYTLVISTTADDNANYNITRTEGAIFEIAPYEVTIVQNPEVVLSHDYNNGVLNEADLFVAPQGFEGELSLSFVTTDEKGETASIQHAGTYKVVASLADGQTNYVANSVEVSYTVNKKALVIGTETAPEKLQSVYNGEALTDEQIRALFTAPLNYDEIPFELSVSANGEIKNADTYTVSADIIIPEEEKGDYTYEQASVQYVVNQVVIDGAIVLPEQLIYDGNAKEASFVVSDGAMVGNDKISIAYDNGETVENAIEAGAYTVTVSLPEYTDGKSNYKFAEGVTTSVEMVISPVSVVIAAKENQTKAYDGKAFDDFASLFDIPVDKDGMPLQYDFAVTKGGEVAAEIKDAGEYTVTATLKAGQDNYLSNSAVATFTVSPVRFEIDFGEYGTTDTGLTIVKGEEFNFSAKIVGTDGANVQVGDTSYAYTVGNNGWNGSFYNPAMANVGETYTLKFTLEVTDLDKANYTYDTRIDFKIIASPMEGNLTAENDGVIYDGKAYGATFQPTTGGVTEEDYQIEYTLLGTEDWTTEKPVNAGTYQARVVSLDENYSDDRIAVITFVINKAEAVVNVTVAQGNLFEGYGLPVISLGEGGTKGTIVWTNSEDKLIAGSHEYSWTFTSEDPNYNDATGTFALEAQAVVFDRIEIEKTESFKTEYTYGDEFDKTTIVVKAVNNDGTFSVLEADDYTVDALTTGATSVNVTYNEKTVAVDGFVVNKKTVSAPVVNDETFVYSGSVINVELQSDPLYTLGGEMSGTDAGAYKMTATLTDSANYKWADSEDATIEIVWNIAKATRAIEVNVKVEYKSLKVAVEGDGANVQYSLDGKAFSDWDGKAIAVDFAESYKVYFKYAESDNYLESAVVTVEKNVTKDALAQYISESFGETLTFLDVDKYNEVLAMAKKAEGNSEKLDGAIAALSEKYNALINGAKESAEEALGAGSKLAGNKVVAATALTLTTAFTGVGLAVMSLRVRKGGKKNDKE